MKTSVTLTFDSSVLEAMKKNFTGRSLSSFTNSLYTDWLEARKREQLIAACKRVSKSKVYKEVAESMEGVGVADWTYIDELEKKRVS